MEARTGSLVQEHASMREDVLQRLRRRDRSEKRPYEDLVKSHARLQQECKQRERTHLQMSQQMSIQTEELRELRESSGKEGGGGRCTKCSQMQDELTRNLREKADDKQQIIQLESVVRKLQAQLAKAEAAANEAQVNAREQQQSITEKDAKIEDMHQNIQVLTEEVASRTIELHELRPQLRRADAENQQLISQLLTIKEGIADKYNEINEMQQEAERIKRSAELMAAAKSLEAPAPPADTGDVSPGEMVSARLSMRGLAFGCQVPTAPRRAVVAHERNEIHSLAHNSSGAMVLTGSDDRSLKLWDTRNGTRLAALEGAVKGVMSVGFSDDGKHVLGASNDFAVRIWSLKSQRVLHVLTGHQNKIYCAAFSPDSTLVYSGGYDRLIKLWDASRGLVTHSINCSSSCNDARMTQSGAILVSVHLDASVRLWDVRTAQMAHEISRVHKQPITSVSLVPNKEHEIVTNSRDDSLQVLDIRKNSSLRYLAHASYKNGVNWNRAAVSPDGQFVVAGGQDGSLVFWNRETGEHASTIKNAHKSAVVSCSWGNNDELVSVEREHSMIFWQ